MISVTQPRRRGADEFLQALVGNLQQQQPRRRRVNIKDAGPRKEVPAEIPVPPKKVAKVAKPVHQPKAVLQPKPKPEQKPPIVRKKPQRKPSSREQEKNVKKKPKQTEEQVDPVEQPLPPQPAVTNNFIQNPYPDVNYLQQNALYPPRGTVLAPAPQTQPALRQSQNNFYHKNKSNIFDMGPGNVAESQNNFYHKNKSNIFDMGGTEHVVEKALKIAEQQPLPAYQSLHTPKRNPGQREANPIYPQHQVEVINQQPQQHAQQQAQHVSYNTVLNQTKPINSHYTQSFNISGADHTEEKSAKELERRKWIQDLEAQVREKKEREGQRKAEDATPQPTYKTPYPQQQQQQTPVLSKYNRPTAHNSVNDCSINQLMYNQAAPVQAAPVQAAPVQTAPVHSQYSQPAPILSKYNNQPTTVQNANSCTMDQLLYNQPVQGPQPVVPHHAMPQQQRSVPKLAFAPDPYSPQQQYTPQQQYAPPPQTSYPPQQQQLIPPPVNTSQPTSPVGAFILGQNNVHVDPVELERRTAARQRALENQECIRQQVEERERAKREKAERRRFEEEQEMKRIEAEKRRMDEELRLESERARTKERAQQQQIDEMRRKIEEANKTAADLKKAKRHYREAPSPQIEAFREAAPLSPVIPTKRDVPRQPRPTNNHVTHQPHSNATHHSNAGTQNTGTLSRMQQHNTQQYSEVINEAAPCVRSEVPRQESSPVRYVTHAGTQTVTEVSCQTMSSLPREDSFLPSESKLIQLQERELSCVQVHSKRNAAKPPPPAARKPASKAGFKAKPAPKTTRQPPQQSNIAYDKKGHRIKPAKPAKPARIPDEKPLKSIKEVTPSPDYIIAEESVNVEEYQSIADIFDNPTPIPRKAAVDEYSLPEQQIQMRYTSPKNETRSIPSTISARQNNILNQLEKLRMGLQDRRRHLSKDGETGTT